MIPEHPDCSHLQLDIQLRCCSCGRDFSAYEEQLVAAEVEMLREYSTWPADMKLECRVIELDDGSVAYLTPEVSA